MIDNHLIVCHYGEIGLKGKNRKIFEERLVENIKKALPKGSFNPHTRTKTSSAEFAAKGGRSLFGVGVKNVSRISGRLLVELEADADKKIVEEKLANVFGLVHFSFAWECRQDIGAIRQKAVEILKELNFETFRISAKRSEKTFFLNSQKINEQVGEAVISELSKKVKLKDPDLTLFIEVVNKKVFLFTEKLKGLGGLPVGVSGRGVSLISGGIDSPVASFYAMKRGLELVFVHFHALPYVDKASVDKVKEIVKVLSAYQPAIKLYLVPFGDIQKEILLKTNAKLRVVLYRRFMVRIAEKFAKKEKAKALITGENIGQVASQTLENITAIEDAAILPIFRPLGFFDKQEIVNVAKELKTYDLSILPEQDCCSRFLPQYPETKADISEVKQEETALEVDKLIKQAINKTKIWQN